MVPCDNELSLLSLFLLRMGGWSMQAILELQEWQQLQ